MEWENAGDERQGGEGGREGRGRKGGQGKEKGKEGIGRREDIYVCMFKFRARQRQTDRQRREISDRKEERGKSFSEWGTECVEGEGEKEIEVEKEKKKGR